MTDRVNALTVILDRDLREDDVQFIVNAIRAIRCVGDVQMNVTNITDAVAEHRARMEYHKRITDALGGIFYPKLDPYPKTT